MQLGKVVIVDRDPEVREQVAALGHREGQVALAQFAEFAGHPQPVQAEHRIEPAGEHELCGAGRPPRYQVGHTRRQRLAGAVEVTDDDGRPGWQSLCIIGERRRHIRRQILAHAE